MTITFPETADIETSSDDYARRFAGDVGRWFLDIQADATLRMLASYPGATILDVGGGHGQTIDALVENGYDVTVFGSAAVCRARIQHVIDAGKCRFDVGSILELPYPDQAFDVVVSYRLLPHVERWDEYLAELARVARFAVILDYPEIQSINAIEPLLFRYKKQIEGNTRPYTSYRQSTLVKAFRTWGFTYSDRYRQFALPMVLHRRLKQRNLSEMAENVCRLLGLTSLIGSPVILKFTRSEA